MLAMQLIKSRVKNSQVYIRSLHSVISRTSTKDLARAGTQHSHSIDNRYGKGDCGALDSLFFVLYLH